MDRYAADLDVPPSSPFNGEQMMDTTRSPDALRKQARGSDQKKSLQALVSEGYKAAVTAYRTERGGRSERDFICDSIDHYMRCDKVLGLDPVERELLAHALREGLVRLRTAELLLERAYVGRADAKAAIAEIRSAARALTELRKGQ
jgi:hypothetical protein